jgi:O-antigen/teichoic acid export membrane protein
MWRNVMRLGGGTAIGQAIVFAAMPLLTRLYPPGDFGQFGLYLAFASVAMVFVGLRYDLAAMSAASNQEAAELFVAALLACIPTSVVAGFVLWLLITRDLLGFGALPLLAVPVTALLLFATGVVMALRYWNVRDQRFNRVGTASVLQGLGRALVPLGLAVTASGWWGLLAGDAAGRLLGVTQLARGAIERLRPQRLNAVLRAARRQWRYPAIVVPSSLLDAIASAVPLPIVSTLFGVEAAGQFALVQRVAAVPVSLVGASFADVIHAEAVRQTRSGLARLRPLGVSSVKRLALVGAAIYVPVLVLAPFVFPWLFGDIWEQAGIVAAILAPALWLTLVVSPVSRLILVTGRTGLKFVADLVKLTVPSAALLMGREAGFIGAVVAFGAASFFAYLFYLGVIWLAIRPARTDTRR